MTGPGFCQRSKLDLNARTCWVQGQGLRMAKEPAGIKKRSVCVCVCEEPVNGLPQPFAGSRYPCLLFQHFLPWPWPGGWEAVGNSVSHQEDECLIPGMLEPPGHGDNKNQRSFPRSSSFLDNAHLYCLSQGGATPTTAFACHSICTNLSVFL